VAALIAVTRVSKAMRAASTVAALY
jgi:hypothetical protein